MFVGTIRFGFSDVHSYYKVCIGCLERMVTLVMCLEYLIQLGCRLDHYYGWLSRNSCGANWKNCNMCRMELIQILVGLVAVQLVGWLVGW